MPRPLKRKVPVKLAAPLVKSQFKLPVKHSIDKSRTTVSGPDSVRPPNGEPINISSDEDSAEDDDDDNDDISDADDDGKKEEEQQSHLATAQDIVNGNRRTDMVSDGQPQDDEEEKDDDDEETSPSFGELLRENEENEVIDVPALLQQSSTAGALVPSGQATIGRISSQSLTSVLTQALRTDDTKMLESCLHSADETSIRNTVEGLDSALAGVLLNSLAARLHRRPGRAGILMSWVQWTLVAHGGALASQPKVVQSLRNLQSVLAERAKGLNSLLVLKGKLDLLNFQMELRRKRKASSRQIRGAHEDEDEQDQHLIYVEGEEKRADKKKAAMNGNGLRNKRDNTQQGDNDDDMSSLLDEAVVDSDDDDDDEEEDDEDDDDDVSEEDNVHDKQSNRKPQEDEVDEVDEEDVDESMGEEEQSEESEEEDAAPPTKMQKTASRISRKRK